MQSETGNAFKMCYLHPKRVGVSQNFRYMVHLIQGEGKDGKIGSKILNFYSLNYINSLPDTAKEKRTS